ncbi:hypothetical protein, partial [Burkholderia latens]|uniref:hypothetical protein n=1 Tax=Burkholderia latens TaxID=488446 RepID=UPI001E654B4B
MHTPSRQSAPPNGARIRRFSAPPKSDIAARRHKQSGSPNLASRICLHRFGFQKVQPRRRLNPTEFACRALTVDRETLGQLGHLRAHALDRRRVFRVL